VIAITGGRSFYLANGEIFVERDYWGRSEKRDLFSAVRPKEGAPAGGLGKKIKFVSPSREVKEGASGEGEKNAALEGKFSGILLFNFIAGQKRGESLSTTQRKRIPTCQRAVRKGKREGLLR